MNALWFMGVGLGVLTGWWLKCMVSAVQDLRDAREARIGELLVGLVPPSTPTPARRYTAKDILGYRDLGGRRVAPTHPVCAAAPTSAAALAAWERSR